MKNIVLPIDRSDVSLKAIKFAVELAKGKKSQIFCIHVIRRPSEFSTVRSQAMSSAYEEAKKRALKYLEGIRSSISKENIPFTIEIYEGESIVESILSYSKRKNADIIVMGTRGATQSASLMIGSVAVGVVIRAHCPVLVVR